MPVSGLDAVFSLGAARGRETFRVERVLIICLRTNVRAFSIFLCSRVRVDCNMAPKQHSLSYSLSPPVSVAWLGTGESRKAQHLPSQVSEPDVSSATRSDFGRNAQQASLLTLKPSFC